MRMIKQIMLGHYQDLGLYLVGTHPIDNYDLLP